MAHRDEIVSFCNDLLELHKYPDYGPMGLQFVGHECVTKMAVAVTVNKRVIEQAHEQGANLLLVHHGMFWNNESRIFDDRIEGRLELLEKYEMSLLAYHLALDTHDIIGNNKLAAESLGLSKLKRFAEMGWGGEYKEPMTWTEFRGKVCDTFLKEAPNTLSMNSYSNHPNKVHKVAVLVGAASHYVVQAHREGYDTFFTGEASEPAFHLAQDLEMNWIAAGHDLTEQAGVKRLGKILKRKFRVDSIYIPTGNWKI